MRILKRLLLSGAVIAGTVAIGEGAVFAWTSGSCPSTGQVCFRPFGGGATKYTSSSDSDFQPEIGATPDFQQRMNTYYLTMYNQVNWVTNVGCFVPEGAAAPWRSTGGSSGGLVSKSEKILTGCG